jgi:transposase-like protein
MTVNNAFTGTDAALAAIFADESKAREFLEKKRWPNGPVCPHCNCKNAYALTPKQSSMHPVRDGVYKCKVCRKQFTIRIGTVFEESKISLCKWVRAIHLMTSNKMGVSSHQIARETGITQKSAWFVNHRIREAMKQEPLAGMLYAAAEVDETSIGGEPRSQTPTDSVEPETSDVARKFKQLAKQWRKETRLLSVASRMASHPAYRRIVELGWAVVPLLLAELRRKPDHWFIALAEITGENPILPENEGKLNEMAEAWIRWGEQGGYFK